MPSRPCKGLSGCIAIRRMAGLYSRRRRPVPMNVPLVPSPATKCVICAVRLRPDLRAGRLVVRAPVGVVAVLVGVEVALGRRRVAPPRLADRAVAPLLRVGQDDLGAVGAQDALALRAGVRGQAELDPVAERRADHRQAMPVLPLVASRIVFSGVSSPRAMPSRDHRERRAVLDAAAGIEPLRLRRDGHGPWEMCRDARQLDQWCVADEVHERRHVCGCYLCHA